ncbi:MAG: heme o synthase [Nitrososphaerota archaeon]|nr:heme o synthase [Nitrososphaerota archaeon]MDG6967215.1 heme o synthase [Nitrososphaerota archaeon]MDG6978850.1 heme o synthase [Nitrososphaerota archaeon]MDG7021377.1 heme o synthase [Nitrososphaerota archaeon]
MSMRDYIALTKPKILWLLLLVALASAVIAERALPPLITLAGLFMAGALSSMGSLALNSYLEMDIDAKMRRTRNRPLPAERIVQPGRALAFGLALIAMGLAVSWVTLTPLATLFIGLGAVVYVQVYTVWLKPRTSWNIVLGGFAGSCCALAGWYAVTSADALIAWVLAALVFVWTPSHFWSLAVITEEDYSAAGIPMLPSIVGEKRAAKFIVANTLLLIPISLLFFLYLTGAGEVIYLAGALVFDLLLLATNVKLFIAPTKGNALLAFKASSPFLAVIFLLACVSVLV